LPTGRCMNEYEGQAAYYTKGFGRGSKKDKKDR